MKTLLFFIMAVAGVNASAHLFDSVADCDRRYGKAVSVKGSQRIYKKNGFGILVNIYKGKVDCIIYQKVSGAYMSEAEMINIMSQNEPSGTSFIKLQGDSHYTLCNEKTYKRDTREGGSFVIINGNTMMIITFNCKARSDAKDYGNTSGL